MKSISLKKKLCLNFCPYYKPSNDNDLACMGFLVIERLIKKGKKISFKKMSKALDGMTEKLLKKHLCTVCSFYESDCDFAAQKENASPCGGFILLGHLLETNIITIDDLNNASYTFK
jgi:hypothetical protein